MDGFSNRAGGALQSEPDSHRRSAGVVLPTSLLDALLRSVPAASVPPLLTATLLTPFLTADYATSLLRERCILEGAPDHEHTDALRGHCASEAGGLSVRLRDHGQSIPAARPLTDDDLDGVLNDLDIGLRLLAPQRRRDFFRGYLPIVDNRLAMFREGTILDVATEYLSMSRTQWVARFPCDVSFSLCVLHLPPYRCIDGTTRHGQLELKTPNTSDAYVPLLGTSHTPLQTLIGLLDHDSCYEYECDDDGWDLSSEEEEEEE